MPIKIPDNLPAVKQMEKENIFPLFGFYFSDLCGTPKIIGIRIYRQHIIFIGFRKQPFNIIGQFGVFTDQTAKTDGIILFFKEQM